MTRFLPYNLPSHTMDLSELSHFWAVRVLGLYLFIRIAYYLLYSTYEVLKMRIFPTDLRKFGEWAVVTGSTDGIGKALARELARKGVNIILISRSEDKLTQTAAEIENDFRVKTLYVQADFSKRDCYKNIEEKLKGLDIGILVNNVGIASNFPRPITEFTKEELWAELDVNCGSYVIMSYFVLPQMKAKKKGLIINMSSLSSDFGLPWWGTYASTKSFNRMFSLHLQAEVEKHNIKVCCFIPGIILTNILKDLNPSVKKIRNKFPILAKAIFPDANEFASYAINNFTSDYKVITGYWGHTILMDGHRWLPVEYKMKIVEVFIEILAKW